MHRPAGERSARRGQGHQILCHPETAGITEVIPADAADWDDGKPFGSRLEDEPREVYRGESGVDLAGRVERAQRRVVFTTSRTWTPDCAVTTVWSGRALWPSSAVVRWSARYVAPNGRVVRTHGTEVFRRI